MKDKMLEVFKRENVRVVEIKFDEKDFYIIMEGELNYIRARRFVALNNWKIDANGFNKRGYFYIEGYFEDRLAHHPVSKGLKIGDDIIYREHRISVSPAGEFGYHLLIDDVKYTYKTFYSIEKLITQAKIKIDNWAFVEPIIKEELEEKKSIFSVEEVITLEELQMRYTKFVIENNKGNKAKTSRDVGICQKTLRDRIWHYAVKGNDFFKKIVAETENKARLK